MKSKLLLALALAMPGAVPEIPGAENKTADACAPGPGAAAPALPAKILPGQGTVHFPITTSSEEAQRFFNQGIAQMHSFWAREAERSFLQAATLDPLAPMPHFGIAMVAAGDYRPRFQIDRNEAISGREKLPAASRSAVAARKALELSAVPGKATELEKLYIAAVAARRNPEARHPEDDFVDGLRTLLAKHPAEVEARSYLALMVMRGFVLPGKKPRAPGTTEAVDLLRKLMVDAPGHPGVHHYVIHGWEGSSFANEAWPSCERYAQLVTNIPHALHMPGHIYSQTGRWSDAIQAFEAASANELGYMRADSLYGSGHHGHNVHYLATSYAFAGDFDPAIKSARGLLEFKDNPRELKQLDNTNTAWTQGWFALLRTLVQFEKWELLQDEATLPMPAKPRYLAWRAWALGVADAARGDAAAARRRLTEFDEALRSFRTLVRRPDPPELLVAREELTGHIALASGKVESGLRMLRKAAGRERGLRYTEPPSYPRPVLEALGRAALKHGRPAIAKAAFREALEQYPADRHAETGLRTARKAQNEPNREAGL